MQEDDVCQKVVVLAWVVGTMLILTVAVLEGFDHASCNANMAMIKQDSGEVKRQLAQSTLKMLSSEVACRDMQPNETFDCQSLYVMWFKSMSNSR